MNIEEELKLENPTLYKSIQEQIDYAKEIAYKKRIKKFITEGENRCSICNYPFKSRFGDYSKQKVIERKKGKEKVKRINRKGVMFLIVVNKFISLNYNFDLCFHCDDKFFRK